MSEQSPVEDVPDVLDVNAVPDLPPVDDSPPSDDLVRHRGPDDLGAEITTEGSNADA